LALVAIVGEKSGSVHFTHGSSNVPLLIVIGCVYMELLFLQSERELHWPEWSLDAISCAWKYYQPRTCWFATTL